MSELWTWRARDLAAAIRERRLSSVEVVTAFLDRIDAVDGKVNAITTKVPRAEALAAAERADEAVAAGAPLGPIHGLPIAVKDLMDVAGIRTTHGSVAYADAPPATKDSLLAERLRAGGAIFVGKTNTPEHGLGTLTYNGIFGPTTNPWNVRKNAGGSSGGAGAAVAAGMLPFADGSDSGGSIRYPAAFCNLVGLRPSPGRVPSGRPGDGWTPHGVLGPIARDAADAGLLLSALAGADPRAPLSLDDDPAQFADVRPADLKGLRIAWSPTGGGLPIDPEVSRVLGETTRLLAAAGAEVDEIEPTFFEHADECWEIVEMLGFVEAAGKLVDDHRSEVRRDLARNVDQGRAMTPDQIARGFALRTEISAAPPPCSPTTTCSLSPPRRWSRSPPRPHFRPRSMAPTSTATSSGSGSPAASSSPPTPPFRSPAASPPTACRSACSWSGGTAGTWTCSTSPPGSRPRPASASAARNSELRSLNR
jgi:amidase